MRSRVISSSTFGTGAAVLIEAAEMQQRAQLSFWDAMVVQAALTAGCDTLYTEDLNAGQRFGSLIVVNPFKTTAHARRAP